MRTTNKMRRPSAPFTTEAELWNPKYEKVQGVERKTYELAGRFMCSFKAYGGTESMVNDVISVIDTANIETWYRPDISASSRMIIDNKTYEIMGEPEDIELRHQLLLFKIRRVFGGA